MTTTTAHPPLTVFSEDEQLFRDAVAAFANDEVRSRVQAMERGLLRIPRSAFFSCGGVQSRSRPGTQIGMTAQALSLVGSPKCGLPLAS